MYLCTCPECGAMFEEEQMDLPNDDLAPDLAALGCCPACDHTTERDEFFA